MNPRKLLTTAAVSAAWAVASVSIFAPCSFGQIVGSKHDLSEATGGGNWTGDDATNQVCIYCHTPHNSAAAPKPLWNRSDTQENFTTYQSPTFQGQDFFADANGHQPMGDSKLCLSCHDGVTALNAMLYSYNGQIGMIGNFDQLGDVYYPGSPFIEDLGPNIGENFPRQGGNFQRNNLANDHPISFAFNQALIAADADGGAPQLRLPPADDGVKLRGVNRDQVECSSCHNVHNPTFEPFLVKSNSGSQICLTCHLK